MSLRDVLNKVSEEMADHADKNPSVGSRLWDHLSVRGAEPDPRREEGNHPSQMYGFCPRRNLFEMAWGMPKGSHDPELMLTFDWGTSWHKWVQNQYLGPMGMLWGDWRCVRCWHVESGFMPKGPCLKCRDGVECKRTCVWTGGFDAESRNCSMCRRWGGWDYQEPLVRDPELNMVGHPDGVLVFDPPDGERVLAEFKTIAEFPFQKLTAPYPSHIFQVQVYLHLMKLRRCNITYWTKGRQQPPKEFWIEYDPDVYEEVRRRIRVWERSKRTRTLSPVRICESKTDPIAKDCVFAGKCFQRDIDEVIDELFAAGVSDEQAE